LPAQPTSIEIAYLQAWRARLNLAQGKLAEAETWAEIVEAEMKGTEITGPLDPMREFALLTLARIWLAQGKTSQAASLLESIRMGQKMPAEAAAL
jgi:hypothetical protein